MTQEEELIKERFEELYPDRKFCDIIQPNGLQGIYSCVIGYKINGQTIQYILRRDFEYEWLIYSRDEKIKKILE